MYTRVPPKRSYHSTAFLDGLRGIFALAVVNQHVLTAFQRFIFYGYGLSEEDSRKCSYRHELVFDSTHIIQLPIVRLIYSGDAGVCVFFVLSGFAISFRALGRAHHQDWVGTFEALSSSVFRRGIRLFLPLVPATLMTMISLQCGLWEAPRQLALDTTLFRGVPEDFPQRFDSFGMQILHWVRSWWRILYVWSWDETYLPPYDGHLWTIPVEFRASMVLYLTLLSVSRVIPLLRGIVLACCSFYAYCSGRWDVCLFLTGALLADTAPIRQVEERRILQQRVMPKRAAWKTVFLVKVLHAVITLVALFLLSGPAFCIELTPGYQFLASLIPSSDPQPFRFYPILGSVLLVTMLVHGDSKSLLRRSLLDSFFAQYLGRISYSVYILHGPLFHVLGYRIFALSWQITGDFGSWRYIVGFLAGWMIFMVILVWMADLFCRFVDEPSIRFAKWLESVMIV
ncbi:acyltransferase 3 [Aspergillus bertholletiae]|uniref:Acyltransferase 3 n=1 Tax=Aspergillus bertholletiae TaxID=1226010 RepID=A0A5N7B985_9EURO|nr:acyltransferase 3 [Aspergillus bertholletiae]